MPDLDYAFLADYARVDPSGTLTAVGASYTQLTTDAVPSTHLLSVAGRVRSKAGAPPVGLEIILRAPDAAYTMTLGAELQEGPGTRPYADGRIGLLFAVTAGVPIVAEGLYEVEVRLEGEARRLLVFEVKLREP